MTADLEALTARCFAGEAEVCLSMVYRSRSPAIERDIDALRFARQACELGDPLGCYFAAEELDGRVEPTRDEAKIAELYRRACSRIKSACDRAEVIDEMRTRAEQARRLAEADTVTPSVDADDQPNAVTPEKTVETKMLIREEVSRRKHRMQACYGLQLAAWQSGQERARGQRFSLAFGIVPEGRITSASIVEREGAASLAACILHETRQLSLGPTHSRGVIPATYVFVFKQRR